MQAAMQIRFLETLEQMKSMDSRKTMIVPLHPSYEWFINIIKNVKNRWKISDVKNSLNCCVESLQVVPRNRIHTVVRCEVLYDLQFLQNQTIISLWYYVGDQRKKRIGI